MRPGDHRRGRAGSAGQCCKSRAAALAVASSAVLLGSCGGGDVSSDSATATPSAAAVASFAVYPKYLIGSVIYAPPGANSSVTYGPGTITGTTVSTTDNWSKGSSAGTQTGVSSSIFSITLGNGFGGATAQSVDMQNTSIGITSTYKTPLDSIDHDYDRIVVFPGVNVNASVDALGNVTWGMDFSQMMNGGFVGDGYQIYVGCLRSGSAMASGPFCVSQVDQLSSWGITPADYPTIIGADPFADPNASQTPDPNRYVLFTSYPYLPVPGGGSNTYWGTTANSSRIANAQTSSYSYSVSAMVSASYDGLSLKDPTRFTWTNSSTSTNETGSSQSITIVVASPSSSYSGPFTLFVYLDTIYKTFMFSFVPAPH